MCLKFTVCENHYLSNTLIVCRPKRSRTLWCYNKCLNLDAILAFDTATKIFQLSSFLNQKLVNRFALAIANVDANIPTFLLNIFSTESRYIYIAMLAFSYENSWHDFVSALEILSNHKDCLIALSSLLFFPITQIKHLALYLG